mmetsp:Transcript_10802/g.28347  ORF Transcript_10802/g.28347 Transcript_10802/m.28347 type:complete len:313 (-) Transcript_10802:67-1005(-)
MRTNPKPWIRQSFLLQLEGDQEKDSLLDSLLSLKKFIFEEHDYYPILLLNDGTITASDLAKYRRVMNPSLILEERMSLDVPAYLKYRMPPLRIPEHLFGRTVKERSLCRYRAGEFLRIGVLQSFDWFMLMEPGVRILDAFSFDPFVFMESEQLDYGYAASGFDAVETTAGLWDLTQEYFLHEDLPFAIPERVAHIASGSDYDRSTIYPAFEIAKMSALRSKLMYKFFSYIDWSGGFYSKGYCAPAVRQLQISGFLHPDRIHHFRTLPIQYGPFLSPPLGFTEEEVQRLRKKYSEKYGLVFGPDEHPLFAIAV